MSTIRNSHSYLMVCSWMEGKRKPKALSPLVEENPTVHLLGEHGLLMLELGFLFLLGIGKGEITESLNLNVK